MNNKNNLFDLLEQLPTEELDQMLHSELRKDPVDGDAVRMILRVLKKQDEGQEAEIDAGTQKAWEKYQEDIMQPQRKLTPKKNWLLRIAAAAAVLCLVLLAAPQDAEAESFIGMLTRWTDSIFEFFDPKDRDTNPLEYEFKTDNPGLQQVYNTVVEMGVTEPVVPMWLPEGFELISQEFEETRRKRALAFKFQSGQENLIVQIDICDSEVPRTYHKDETYIGTYEREGIEHTILKNNERWVTLWSVNNINCTLIANCQESEFYRIVESIYDMEGSR